MAGRPQAKKLSEKHMQALELLKSGMERKDVAAKMGWSVDHFKKLCSGDVSNCGYTADLFKKELQKIENDKDENIRILVQNNTETAQSLIKIALADLTAKKKLDYSEKKLLALFNNSLNKSKPTVNIKSLSYSYTQGLNPEDLIHEFQRLQSIAENSFNRKKTSGPTETQGNAETASDAGSVPSIKPRRSGRLPGSTESGSGVDQD